MLKLSEIEILERISAGDLFECVAEDDSFILKIEEYTPAICTAIHDGHKMREATQKHCALDAHERLYEEDPFTCQLIDSMPITLAGGDSRYEYDLNRPVATCIYKKAWGKTVWKTALPTAVKKQNIAKHQRFYRILDALISKIEKLFGACIVFDVHSYNHLRHERETPTFNIGTEQIDQDRWKKVLEHFTQRLASLSLENIAITAKHNDIFFGRGYLIAHTNGRFENTLVLPLEIKKIFMDEYKGELYPLVFNNLKEGIKHCFTDSAAFFSRKHTRKQSAKRIEMLSSQLEPAIAKVDRQLYKLAKNLETLLYITPVNINHEKKRFFAQRSNYQPQFRYRPLDIDPYLFREKLYRLPVDEIRDPSIQQLYRRVIDGMSSKIDLLVNAGTPDFIYNSLQYYGEPSLDDEKNAAFLMHATDFEETQTKNINADELVRRFREQADHWGMKCKVETSSRLVAAAMVSNSRKAVYVNRDALLSEVEANALLHHELGVHMATTLNASQQKLKVFSLGLPGNTMTQEGLAILNEFHSGNLPLIRLKELALRVLAVREMINHGDFRHTYNYLVEEHRMSSDNAFKLAVRVHRSGGFTKDYLYLRGVSIAYNLNKSTDISNLYIGKTGFDSLGIINEMISREMISSPVYLPVYLTKSKSHSAILDYLMASIRLPANIAVESDTWPISGQVANG
jgi:uncharacterized protein (TIGR02421 family)